MRLLVTGETGVLGRAFLPLAEAAGHKVRAPARAELDLFDPAAVAAVIRDVGAVLHLATRVQSLDMLRQPEAWHDNDRLRAEASANLVDGALAANVNDAARALLAALALASGIYNVCRDGERISNRRFAEATGWHRR